jgi:uncharacterized protein YdhG (YjbR/CyaY superfamily)
MHGGTVEKQKPSASVDEYIAGCPAAVRARLKAIRKAIREAAPGATESISYRMPAYDLEGPLVYFAAFKSHIGFFPTASGVAEFTEELRGYRTSKGAIQLPLEEPLPLGLIKRIVRFKVRENKAKRAR